MIRYITDANVLKTQLFLVCFLNTTIFKSQEYTFLLDYSTHLFVKIFQRSYKMLDNWIRVFPIRDELGSNKHRFQFSPQKGNLLHLNIYVSKIFSQFKNSPPPQYGIIFIPEQKCKNYHRKVVLRVFLAHTETGSTGNLVRELGSGDFWLSSSPGEQDEPLALMDQKLAASLLLRKVVWSRLVTNLRLRCLGSFK